MSWKATAYVKDLTSNITVSEKLLLFVLSDYYNDHKQIAWPSIKKLAEEALMSERNAQRILRSLESKGIIKRTVRHGLQTSLYDFCALSTCQNVMLGESQPDKSESQPDNQGISTGRSCVTQTVEQENSKFSLIPPSEDEKVNGKKPDPRTKEFRDKLKSFYKFIYEEEYSWSAADSKQLHDFLKRNRALKVVEFHRWLRNYRRSENVNLSRLPYEFLPTLHHHRDGPLDKYGKPLEESRVG